MSAVERQNHFCQSVVILLDWLHKQGYQTTFGEAFRPDFVAKIYAQKGMGIVDSQHCKRLAIDLNIFKNDVYLQTKEDLQFAGEFWEALSSNGLKHRWGGNYHDRPDTDHFELLDA